MPSSRSRWFGVSPMAGNLAARRSVASSTVAPWPPRPASAPAPGCPTGRARSRRCCARSAAGAGDPTHARTTPGRTGAPSVRRRGRPRCASRPRPSTGDVLGRAWGPGAEWALDRLPALLGADDDPSGFEPPPPAVAEGWRRHRHWRIGGTGLVMEALVPSIIEQKVTGKQAFGSFRELVRRHGEPAPGPVAALRLMLQPTPATIARDPVVGVAAPRRTTRPVAHHGHRLPAGVVARAGQPGVGRGGRPAAAVGPRHRRVDQRRGAPARARRRRRGQLRRLPRRQGSAGRSSATTSPTTRWRELSSPTAPSAAGPPRWRSPAASTAAARAADEHPDAPADPLVLARQLGRWRTRQREVGEHAPGEGERRRPGRRSRRSRSARDSRRRRRQADPRPPGRWGWRRRRRSRRSP